MTVGICKKVKDKSISDKYLTQDNVITLKR